MAKAFSKKQAEVKPIIERRDIKKAKVFIDFEKRPFVLCFKCKLENDFTFKDLKPNDLPKFQIFYRAADKFRIHGIYVDDLFLVLRLDPMHKFHQN